MVTTETPWMTIPLSSTFVTLLPPRGVEPCWEWKWTALSCLCKLNSHYPLASSCSLGPFGYIFTWQQQDGALRYFLPAHTAFHWIWVYRLWVAWKSPILQSLIREWFIALNLETQTIVEVVCCSSPLCFVLSPPQTIYTSQPLCHHLIPPLFLLPLLI